MPHTLSDVWLCEEAQRKLSTLRHEAYQHRLSHRARQSMSWRDALALQLVRLAQRLSPSVALPSRPVEDA